MSEDEKILNDLIWLATGADLNNKLLDDLVSFGECAYKASLEDGKPKVEYVDPFDPELIKLQALKSGEIDYTDITYLSEKEEKLTMEQIKERFLESK